MTNTTHTDAASAAIAIISTNMLQQIIALQEVINARDAQQRFPTMQEAGLLTKMITALEKLKRFLAPPKPTAKPKRKSEHQPEHGLAALTQLFSAEEDLSAEQDDPSIPAYQQNSNHPTGASVPARPNGGNAFDPDPALFPIEEHEFAAYKHLFDDTRGDRSHTTVVKGVGYGTNWLQYNLYQYCLPKNERRFFYDEGRYHREIAHENIRMRIQTFLRQQQSA